MGWLTRKCGLTCDNLLAADIVTPAAGPLVASPDSHPDLLWGLCGGGGNFGIVTRFRFQAHPIGPIVPIGFGIWRLDDALPVLRRYRDVMPHASDDLRALVELRLGASRPEVGPQHAQTPILGIMAIWAGPPDGAAAAFDELLPLQGALVSGTQEMRFVDLQQLDDDSQGHGANNYTTGGYLDSLDDDTIEALQAAGNAMTSADSMIELGYQHGAQDRLQEHDTAFANRAANYYVNVYARWPIGTENERHVQWARASLECLTPWRSPGVYTNFLNPDDQQPRIDEAFGELTLRRLGAVKDSYDPDNTLRLNQNVDPTRASRSPQRANRSA
jgi:FAD/FMN-containing dehydrogenase